MRTALTIAYKSGQASLLVGPEVPIAQQLRDTAPLKSEGAEFPGGADSVEVWSSDEGVVRRALNRPVKQQNVSTKKDK